MTVDDVREKYLKFFESRGHKIISPAPLVLPDDPTTLFTSSGMQPLVPYLMGQTHPEGSRLVDSQPSFRTVDIEEVGDNRHTTYFEMLGNWSLGDYFKKEQLAWIWEFLTKELQIPKDKLYVSIFEGTKDIPRDKESEEIWLQLRVSKDHIFEYGVNKNWWSRSGPPDEMPPGEPGGPTSEIFYEFNSVNHDTNYGEKCHPNCDCGRFVEIGNSVFMIYKKTKDGSLEELPNKNVDFGGGLERIVMATEDQPDIYRTPVLSPYMEKVEKKAMVGYGDSDDSDKSLRIIAEHMRAVEALVIGGVTPSNKQQGYILRRLIRRAAINMKGIKSGISPSDLDLGFKDKVSKVVTEELANFIKNLEKGTKEINKIIISSKSDIINDPKKIIGENVEPYVISGDVFLKQLKSYHNYTSLPSVAAGTVVFDSLATYGIPVEGTLPIIQNNIPDIVTSDVLGTTNYVGSLHSELSRSQSSGSFKGGLADHSEEVTRLHTATHLLHAALRKVLGDHVSQKGSNITHARLRFDFTHDQKLSEEELKKVEDLINEQIDGKFPVIFEEMTLEMAKKVGALANFTERYGEKIKVYSIGDFSKEVCGGPHVGNTKEIGHVKIIKQEKVGTGVIRIYATNH